MNSPAYTPEQRAMIGHGALIMLVGMIAGFGLLVSLLGGIELIPGSVLPIALFGDSGAWARAHAGGLLNGMMIILFAVIIPHLGFGARGAGGLRLALIGTGWANTLFYWMALIAANRGLTFGNNRFGPGGVASAIGLAPALIFVVVSLIAVGAIARRAFRR